jgi:hypothetical protein
MDLSDGPTDELKEMDAPTDELKEMDVPTDELKEMNPSDCLDGQRPRAVSNKVDITSFFKDRSRPFTFLLH